MRLSNSRVRALKKLLKTEYGIDMTDEEAQQTGLSIMRFTAAKLQRNPRQLNAKLSEHERVQKNSTDI